MTPGNATRRLARRPHWLAAALIALAACADSSAAPPADPETELTIQFIRRLPEIDYVWGSTNPAVEGWPATGQDVTWQAWVMNWSNAARDVGYRWLRDGVEVATGRLSLPPQSARPAELRRPWSFERDELTFVVDPADEVAEEEEGNNELTVYTDAISLGLYVERSLYEYFRANQRRLVGARSTSFEDWAQRHVRRLNQMFAAAVYPETPRGVLDRVRLDRITVVPDGSLPSQLRPNDADRTVDLVWGFKASDVSQFQDVQTVHDENAFYYNAVVLHELGHARGLIDVYTFQVDHDRPHKRVEITEAGVPVAGTSRMPYIARYADGGGILFRTPEQGLMVTQYGFLDRHSAIALNRIAGHRATRGNYNAPENVGWYMLDVPAENRLTLRAPGGAPHANAQVWVYRSAYDPGGADTYAKIFDDVPDMQLTADAQGRVLLGINPFGGQNPIDRFNYSNNVVIVRVESAGGVGYGFLESRVFNYAYWAGATALGEYELTVALRAAP